MLYSSVAAVHAITLLVQFRWTNPSEEWDLLSSKAFGDTDIHPIKVILIVAALLSTPILNWSTSVRRHKAQLIILLWGLLIVGALFPVFIYTSYPDKGPLRNWRHNLIPSFLLCESTGPCSNSTSQFTSKLYHDCGCVDFCGAISPETPLRSGQQMVPLLSAPIDHPWYNPQAEWHFADVNGYSPGLILVYGVLGLLYSQFSNTEFRNLIFRVLIMDRQTFHDAYDIVVRRGKVRTQVPHTTVPSPRSGTTGRRLISRFKLLMLMLLGARRSIAKHFAAAWFSMAILLTLPGPLVFVEVLLFYELDLMDLPYSAQSDAVGAWSSWVVTTLAVSASIILHYQEAVEHTIIKLVTAETPRPATQGLTNTNSNWPRTRTRSLFGSPFVHTYYGLTCVLAYVRIVFLEFKAWFQDPISRSHDTYYETQARWESKYPSCACCFCIRRAREASNRAPSGLPLNQPYQTVGMRIITWVDAKVHVQRQNRLQARANSLGSQLGG